MLGIRLGQVSEDEWRGCLTKSHPRPGAAWHYPPPPDANPDADPDHPLYGQVIVFIGALAMRRVDAWARVAALGATPESGVTKHTTLLVIGDGFAGNDPADFATGKAKKAAAKLARGQSIEVLTEQDFTYMLQDTHTKGAPGRPWRALVTYSREVGLRHEHWIDQDAVRPR